MYTYILHTHTHTHTLSHTPYTLASERSYSALEYLLFIFVVVRENVDR